MSEQEENVWDGIVEIAESTKRQVSATASDEDPGNNSIPSIFDDFKVTKQSCKCFVYSIYDPRSLAWF